MRQTQAILGINAINSFGESQMIEPKLIQHHIKYKELHGEDKIILMSFKEHQALHRRLRKEKKCNIPVDVLHKISVKAHGRTQHYKDGQKVRNKTPEIKKMKVDYRQKAEQRVEFCETVESNCLLFETIIFNKLNGNVYVVSRFQGNHKFKLPIIEVS